MKMSNFLHPGLLAAILLIALPLAIGAETTTNLKISVYDPVVDEQDTTAFYGSPHCPGTAGIDYQDAGLTGDSLVPVTDPLYSFAPPPNLLQSPWSPLSSNTGASYENGTFCNNGNCTPLSAQFISNNSTLNLDTRYTAPSRTFNLDFTRLCQGLDCPTPAGSTTIFNNGSLTTPALINVLLKSPATKMAICSSDDCKEAQLAPVKMWFYQPSDPTITWRIDWDRMRVLRMDAKTWYFIADDCDGSQVAGLSKLIGQRGPKPRTVLNGYYLLPFFLVATIP